MSFYINDANNYDVIDIEKEDGRYLELIDLLSYNRLVHTPSLPIFKYGGVTYSVDDHTFKNKFEFERYFHELDETFFVYFFRIYNDDSIVMRYSK